MSMAAYNGENLMTKRFGVTGKFAALSLAVMAAVAMPLGASARGHGGHYGGHHGYHGGHYGGHYYRGGHGYGHGYHGGYWSGGRWIAGAIVTGAVAGLVSDAMRPTYYGPTVVYTEPRTVVYESAPVVTRRVVETRTVYTDSSNTRYIRDDGYYGD
jgi:hypothetical protein